ncbi:hypothetical protein H1C71_013996 [Ictidomys tridecemlineatus]|nr:hypothetical protein H1C71_013996 [Ictidomys tridecemlineatus]
MGFLSPSVCVKGSVGWVGAKGNCVVGGSVLGLSTGYGRKWIKGKFRLIHLPFKSSAELLSAPGCVDLFEKHQIKINSAFHWVPTLGKSKRAWADSFVKDFSGDSIYQPLA